MDDHFDTSGVFEISKFDISKLACTPNKDSDQPGNMLSLINIFAASSLLQPKDLSFPEAGCSKLKTSLVNVSLNFKTLILQIHCYLQCKRFSHFSNKK